MKPKYLSVPVLRMLLSDEDIKDLGNPGELVHAVVVGEQVIGRIIQLRNGRYLFFAEDHELHLEGLRDLANELHLQCCDELRDLKDLIKIKTKQLVSLKSI